MTLSQKLNDFKRVSVRSFNKCKNQLTSIFEIRSNCSLINFSWASVIREIGSFDENLIL